MAADFTQFGQGMERGVQLAQHAENLAQQREQLEEQKKMNLIKVGDTIMEAYNSAAMLKDKKARQMAFDEARHKSTILGKPVSDSVHSMLTSDAYRTEMLQATASMLGLPDAKRAEQYGSIGQILGGDPKILAHTFMQMREDMTKRAMASAKTAPDPYEPSKQLASLQTSIGNQLKPSADAVSALQSIHGLSIEGFNNLSAHAATVLLNKIMDPGSVVREGEVNTVSAATANGMLERTKQYLRDRAGGGKLSPSEWQTVVQTAELMGEVHNNRIARVRSSYEPLLKGTPLTIDQVFAGLPQQQDLESARRLSQIKGKDDDKTLVSSEQPPASTQQKSAQIQSGQYTYEERLADLRRKNPELAAHYEAQFGKQVAKAVKPAASKVGKQ